MTLRFEGTALVIRDGSNNIRFDSDEGLFHGTNWLTGSFSLNSYSATTTNVSGTQTYPGLADTTTDAAITSCDPGCTHVFGFMRATRSGGDIPAYMNGVWKDASGTQIEGWSSLDTRDSPLPADAGTYRFYMGSMTLQTFYVSGGVLRFKERVILRAHNAPNNSSVVLNRPAVTIEYQLLAGYFL
jgi:hypothetical protein